jgi:predicted nucleic acid-binding protein
MALDRQLVDTNVLVRFFSGEPPEMAAKARRLVERADAGDVILVIVPVILAETFFTLASFYEMDPKVVAEKLGAFLDCRGIEALEKDRLIDALARCATENAHFADSFLASVAVDAGLTIASFDRDFDKFKGVRRLEPR